MPTPRESLEEIARLLVVAMEAMERMPHTQAQFEALSCAAQAYSHAMCQAGCLRHAEGPLLSDELRALAAMPCITETRQ